MRLFDGTAEYVRADEIKVGDVIRHEGEFRRVISTERTEHAHYQIRIGCEDAHGFVAPPTSRLLRKLPIHKAAPAPEFAEDAASVCVHCHREIKRVPGGQRTTWVHADTGAVVGSGLERPSYTREQYEQDRRARERTGRGLSAR